MSGNWTYFPPTGAGGSGTNDYDKDTFPDYSLDANNNTGFTDTALTNPLAQYFGNPDAVFYGQKRLVVDYITLLDASKWINAEPTYIVTFTERTPGIVAYCGGNVRFAKRDRGGAIILSGNDSFFGVSGFVRRVGFLNRQIDTATRNMTYLIDGVSAGNVDTGSFSTGAGFDNQINPNAILYTGSLQSRDIHDFRVVGTENVTYEFSGVVVYNENASTSLDVLPGKTYINKTKVESLASAAITLPALSASFTHLGAVSNIYKTSSASYSINTFNIPVIAAACSGSSGTNLLSAAVGTGASFPQNTGVLIQQGTTFLRAFVQSQSSDVLTLSPTLPFGISGATLTRLFQVGPSIAIDKTLFKLDYSWTPGSGGLFYEFNGTTYGVGASVPAGLLNKQLLGDAGAQTSSWYWRTPDERYAILGSRLTVSASNGSPVFAGLSGATASITAYGDFNAAEVIMYNSGVSNLITTAIVAQGFSSTVSVSGATQGTYPVQIMTNSGIGQQAFRLSMFATFGTGFTGILSGIQRINFYKYAGPTLVGGELARLEQTQTQVVPSGFTTSSQVGLGSVNRFFANQFRFEGTWAQAALSSTLFINSSELNSGIWRSSSAGAAAEMTIYGNGFALMTEPNTPTFLTTLNGASIGVTPNTFVTLALFGPNKLRFLPQGSPTFGLNGIEVYSQTRPLINLRTSFADVSTVNGIIDGARIKPYSLPKTALKKRQLMTNTFNSDASGADFAADAASSGQLYTETGISSGSSRTNIVSCSILGSARPVLLVLGTTDRAGNNLFVNTAAGTSPGVTIDFLRNGRIIKQITDSIQIVGGGTGAILKGGGYVAIDENPPEGRNTYSINVTFGNGTYSIINAQLIAVEL